MQAHETLQKVITMNKWVLALAAMIVSTSVSAMDLVGVYGIALEHDAALKVARATRNAERESLPLAKSALLPNLSVGGSLNYTDSFSDSRILDRHTEQNYASHDLNLSLRQTLYRKDQWDLWQAAGYNVAKAEADYIAAEQDLIIRVANAYFGVLSAIDTLNFSEAEKKANGRQLEQAQQRFDVGLIAITDVHEAQAGYDASVAQVISAETGLDNAWEALQEITGSLPDKVLAQLQEDMPLQSPDPAGMNKWNDFSMENNPSVIASYNLMLAAKEVVESKTAGHYPTLDLVGSYGISRTDSLVGTESDVGNIGVQLAFPIYSGGGVSAATRQAASQYQATQDGLSQTKRAVTKQVKNAYRGVTSSISSVKALKAGTVSAKSALEATEAGFSVGTRTTVDVLISQRSVFSAYRNYSQARYDYILNHLKLKQAAGVLSKDDLDKFNQLLQHK